MNEGFATYCLVLAPGVRSDKQSFDLPPVHPIPREFKSMDIVLNSLQGISGTQPGNAQTHCQIA